MTLFADDLVPACSERAAVGSRYCAKCGGALEPRSIALDASRWYAGRGIVIVAAILSLTLWAFWTSLGGRRALGFVRRQDA